MEELIGLSDPDRARELSDRLLDRFGSFPDALNAAVADRFDAVDGHDVEGLFTSVRIAIHIVLRGRLPQRAVLAREPTVLEYLRGTMAFAPSEQFGVLYPNAAMTFFAMSWLLLGRCRPSTSIHARCSSDASNLALPPSSLPIIILLAASSHQGRTGP